MRYVIGDIHGEYEKLCILIDLLENDATEYIFLGDYIDKCKNSRKTIDFLINLSKVKRCIFLMGDHEYAWLKYIGGEERFLNFLLRYGGIQTLESYSGKELTMKEAKVILTEKKTIRNLLEIHMSFYLKLKFYYEVNDNFLCIHAGINPKNKDVSLEFHNKEELVFIRDKFLQSKFLYRGRKIIFGHTAFKEPYIDEYKIGIDTGAVYKEMGILTAFNVDKAIFIYHDGRRQDLDLCIK